jgi:hypothetical protein
MATAGVIPIEQRPWIMFGHCLIFITTAVIATRKILHRFFIVFFYRFLIIFQRVYQPDWIKPVNKCGMKAAQLI